MRVKSVYTNHDVHYVGAIIMSFSEQDNFDLVIPSMNAANQKQAFRQIAAEVSKIIGIQERIFLTRLIDKEKQTISAMGNGIAVPHLHVSSLTKPVSVFVKLKTPVEFDAPDSMPVDLICLLLTPERDGSAYLRTLARLSRMMRNPQFCNRLRQAEDDKTIRALFENAPSRTLAA